jgi:hypothetical protein
LSPALDVAEANMHFDRCGRPALNCRSMFQINKLLAEADA